MPVNSEIFFYAPTSKDWEHIVLLLSVCLSAQTYRENLTFSSFSYTYSLSRLIFGMKAHLIDAHLVVPTKVKVIGVSTEVFDWWFLYLLVGKVGGT